MEIKIHVIGRGINLTEMAIDVNMISSMSYQDGWTILYVANDKRFVHARESIPEIMELYRQARNKIGDD